MQTFSKSALDLLRIDPRKEVERIANAVREIVFKQFKRKGAIVAVSGGIDSSVVAALCVQALGKDRVLALLLPEAESSGDSLTLGSALVDSLGISSLLEDIAPILRGAECYRRRDEFIRSVVPEYGDGYKCKVALPDMLAADRYAVFSIVVQSPDGVTKQVRLPLNAYLGIVAATNFKQRTRKMIEYYHADRLNYAVTGTPNRLEYALGFFVKGGDGMADLKPIAHLYKTQVYQLAKYLNIPEQIQRTPPTTDTYSLSQSQEEFYFAMPLEKMDACLYAKDHGISPQELAPMVGFTEDQVKRAYVMIDSKRAVARYLHQPPVIIPDAEN